MRRSCFEFNAPTEPELVLAPPPSVETHKINLKYRQSILEMVARSCGCQNDLEIHEFCALVPPVHNPMSDFPEWEKALKRIRQAKAAGEKVVVFGDYDCDGVTSTVLMLEGLEGIGINPERISWFIPNRFEHGYGVTNRALELCVQRHAPDLLIVVDCGSNSQKELAKLAAGGVGGRKIPAIVIDHHHLAKPVEDHPALVLINPTAWPENDSNRGLSKMCAAGLVFLFWDAVAGKLPAMVWDRTRAVILAGLATQADVVPLSHINRSLVKHSLQELAANPSHVLGLRALHRRLHRKKGKKKHLPRVDEDTFGFQWGPCINACGRLDEADSAVALLREKQNRTAIKLAHECVIMNCRRINTEKRIFEEADEQARAQVFDKNPAKVILVAAPHWNIGVVGIVASRLREKYSRPAFVCGKDAVGNWCGSGRSVPGFDIGKQLALASKPVLLPNGEICLKDAQILSGGGHPMAGGVRFTEEQRPGLASWLDQQFEIDIDQLKPRCQIFAPGEALDVIQWRELIRGLHPFGRENPWRPILIRKARLDNVKPIELDTNDSNGSGQADLPGKSYYLFAGHFTAENGRRFQANWLNLNRVIQEWIKGRYYTLELDVPDLKPGLVRKLPYAEPFRIIDCWAESDIQDSAVSLV